MTKEEAIKAKKQLKNNSLPPALSTRSHDKSIKEAVKNQFLRSNKIIFYHEYGIILLYIIVQTVL